MLLVPAPSAWYDVDPVRYRCLVHPGRFCRRFLHTNLCRGFGGGGNFSLLAGKHPAAHKVHHPNSETSRHLIPVDGGKKALGGEGPINFVTALHRAFIFATFMQVHRDIEICLPECRSYHHRYFDGVHLGTPAGKCHQKRPGCRRRDGDYHLHPHPRRSFLRYLGIRLIIRWRKN